MPKTFIISGATSGLGKELVSILYHGSNHQIISLSRRITKEQINYDSRFVYIKCNFGNNKWIRNLGGINSNLLGNEVVLINNAAIINPIKKTGLYEQAEIEKSIYTNLIAGISISNFILQRKISKKITIINISSGAATNPINGWSLYCSSKAALSMYFSVLQQEHPQITVKEVDPGLMNTKMQKEIRMSQFERLNDFLDAEKSGKLKHPSVVAQQILTQFRYIK